MIDAGNHRRGSGIATAQHRGLTDVQIEKAVAAYAKGQPLATIAGQFGVAARTVRTRLWSVAS